MRSRRAPASFRSRLQVEQLEARELLAATVYPAGITPNDPQYPLQWSLHNTGQDGPNTKPGDDIHATAAWTVTTGSMKTVVAVIDTGIDYNNPDLFQNIWINQGEIPPDIRARLLDVDGDGIITFHDLNDPRNIGAGKIIDVNKDGRIDGADLIAPISQGGWADGIDHDHDGYVNDIIGWNFVKNNNNPLDDNDHGTHIAGIIGATGNDGQGIAGIDWHIQMMALKTIDANGFGGTAAAIAGLNFAVAHGASITNNSYGGTGFTQEMYDAIGNARAAGVIYVTAAGNGVNYVGQNLDSNPFYPAAYDLPNIVSVTATTESDTLPDYANYGRTTVDLGAPGRQILSTVRGDKYVLFSGTSMAAAEVTGVLALVKSQHPDWTYYQLINQVEATTDPISALAGKTVTGGRLNAYRAVSQVLGDTTGAYVVSATPNATGAQPVSSIRLTFSEGINASSFGLDDIVSFTGPNGAIKATQIVPVANTDNRQFDVQFPAQSTAGTYSLQLGVNIKDLAGNSLNQNRNNVNGESADGYTTSFVIQPTYTFSSSTQLAIRDSTTSIATLTINQDVLIGDLNVLINLNHTCDNDLYIHLRGPDGTDILLTNRRGGYGHNYTNTLFDDEAAKGIATASAPFTGTFRPEGSLSGFDGKNARGTWQLIIEDRQSGDTGTLFNWSLSIQNAATPSAMSQSGTSSSSTVHTASIAESSPQNHGRHGDARFAALRIESVAEPARLQEVRGTAVAVGQRAEHAILDRVFTRLQSQSTPWSDVRREDAAPTLEELLAFFSERKAK